MNSPPLSSRWQVWPQGPHFLEEDTLVVTSEEFPRSLPSPGRPKCPHHCEHIYLPKCHSQLWGACRDLPWKGHWLFPWHAVLMCKSLNQPGWSWILSLSVLQHCGGQAGPWCPAQPLPPLSSHLFWVTVTLLWFEGSLRAHRFSGSFGFNATPQGQKERPGLSHRSGRSFVPPNVFFRMRSVMNAVGSHLWAGGHWKGSFGRGSAGRKISKGHPHQVG